MSDNDFDLRFDSVNDSRAGNRGGFVALAVIAAALGAGAAVLLAPDEGAKTRKRVGRGFRTLRGEAAGTIAQLQREIRRRRNQTQREKRMIAVVGLLVGAGLAGLLAPESGADARKRLSGTLGRIKVGAIDRIERLRQASVESPPESREEHPVRSIQELGRDANGVF